MTEKAYSKAIGIEDKELFLIEGATHIQTYWVAGALGKLAAFFARTI